MKQQIMETIQRAFHHSDDSISETTRLEEIAMDSLDMVEMIAVLSSRYNMVIEPDRMSDVSTLGDIADYVMKNQGNAEDRHPFGSF